MLRLLLVSVFALPVLCLAAPAHALPEPYVGIGVFGSKANGGTSYAGLVEGGADALYSDFGAGLRVDVGKSLDPALTAELRYSILKLPFIRLLAGGGFGVVARTWNGSVNAWVGGRVSLGVPYLGLRVGVETPGGVHPFSTLTFGLSL